MSAAVEWVDLASRVQARENHAVEQLYALFQREFTYFIVRQLGPDEHNDRVHEVFLLCLAAIQRGGVRDLDCLRGYCWTLVRRQVARYIGQRVSARQRSITTEAFDHVEDSRLNPEQCLQKREQQAIAARAIARLSTRDREILMRFYQNEESIPEICAGMRLTDTQFRLYKNRAKVRLARTVQQALRMPAPGSLNFVICNSLKS